MPKDDFYIEPGQTWEVYPFRPQDAPGVARLFRLAYGPKYPIKAYLEPELLIQENAAGRIISSVARTPREEVVGHNAVFCPAPFAGLRESGAGVVHPAYRGGQGIFTQMVLHGLNLAARRPEIVTMIGEPVCNHLFTQKLTFKCGFTACALEVDLTPAGGQAREGRAGRVSAFLDFKTLVPGPQTIFVPEAYKEELAFSYAGLDDRREFRPASGRPPRDLASRIKTQIFDFAQVARMAVEEAGADFAAGLAEEEERAAAAGVIVFQVWLKLSWPWIGELVSVLNERGYFLGGVLPRWLDRDALLMQKIEGRPGWEEIQMLLDRHREILRMVRADWRRVSGA